MKLHGTNVLLTGACGGIGRALAHELGSRGAVLLLSGRRRDELEELARELRVAHGTRSHLLTTDLASAAGARDLAHAALAVPGGVEVVVHNAGQLGFAPTESESPEAVERMFQVNVVAPVLITRELLPHMRRLAAARVVAVGSIFGSIAFAHFASYSATKFALRGFCEALRRELRGSPVGVTYVAPRAVRTPMSDVIARMASAVKMKLDEPEDVARAIADAVERDRQDVYLGFPERLFVRVNALLPRFVDRALAKQDAKARPYAEEAVAARAASAPTSSTPRVALGNR
jgi:short-subunit dehydrogenase